MELLEVYNKLMDHFGPQDWWPIENDFTPPEFEVCVGAILTQNTNWSNVEKALINLKREGLTNPEVLKDSDLSVIEKAVRPSGFFNQKALRLKIFSDFVLSFGDYSNFRKTVKREDLLKVNGLGPETADSILLFSLGRPVFVIDAYTKRIFTRLGLKIEDKYESWRSYFESNLPKNERVYNEFHALIVELAKTSCKKKPDCENCVIKKICSQVFP